MPITDDRRDTLRITQRRYPSAFLVTLNPWFYDRAGEHEIVQRIRDTGRLANADCYGCGEWLDGRDDQIAFEETEWKTYWSSNPLHDVRVKPGKDHAVASTVSPEARAQTRREMDAARKAAMADYYSRQKAERERQKAERARIKERSERWKREQAEWQKPLTAEQVKTGQRAVRVMLKQIIADYMRAHPYEHTYRQVQIAIGAANYDLVAELCDELIAEGTFRH